VLLEVRINGEPAEPLSVIVHRDASYRVGKALCLKLKELIPRQMFKVPIQVRLSLGGVDGCLLWGVWGWVDQWRLMEVRFLLL